MWQCAIQNKREYFQNYCIGILCISKYCIFMGKKILSVQIRPYLIDNSPALCHT